MLLFAWADDGGHEVILLPFDFGCGLFGVLLFKLSLKSEIGMGCLIKLTFRLILKYIVVF
jgi:hypothetical protein